MKRITAIQKGTGQGETFYKLGNIGVTEIKQVKKPVEFQNQYITKEIEAYQVWSKSGMICEIESCAEITLYF